MKQKYKSQEYDGFRTSWEILAAIETIAGDSILDESSRAYKLWSAPTETEVDQILAKARCLSIEPGPLYWGDVELDD